MKSEDIADEFGIVMENFEETGERFARSFIPVRTAIRDMLTGGNRIYTKSLKENPEKYRRELELYKKAGTVWISYGVPFLIPITAGFLTAMIFGDLLMVLLSLIMI